MLLVSSGSHCQSVMAACCFFLKRVCALYINVLLLDVKFFFKKSTRKSIVYRKECYTFAV